MCCSAQNCSRHCVSTGADYSASQAYGCFQATAGIPVIRRLRPRWSGTLARKPPSERASRSEEHTSELQSLTNLVCRLLLEKKKKHRNSGQPLRPSAVHTHV